MDASAGLNGLRRWFFTVEIKPVHLPVFRPVSVECLCLLFGGNAESTQCEYQGTNADTRLSAWSSCSTRGTPEDRGADVSLGSNTAKDSIQVVPQLDEDLEGDAIMPMGAQPLNHLWKPDSVRVTRGHGSTILGLFVKSSSRLEP